MKAKITKIIPKYAIIPLLSVIMMNFIAYFGNTLITKDFYHYNFTMKIDHILPFCSFFVLFYVLAYIYWIVGYILIARENKETCYKYVLADFFAKTICLIIFIALPTTMDRPMIMGNNIWDQLTKLIYFFDEPVNLFPSIHCLESWICFRGSLALKKTPKWYPILCFISTVFICLSTVFIKQHLFIDIIGGIVVAELGILIVNILIKQKKKRARS